MYVSRLFQVGSVETSDYVIVSTYVHIRRKGMVEDRGGQRTFLADAYRRIRHSDQRKATGRVIRFHQTFRDRHGVRATNVPPFLRFSMFLNVTRPFHGLRPENQNVAPFSLACRPNGSSLFIKIASHRRLLIRSNQPAIRLPFSGQAIQGSFLQLLRRFRLPMRISGRIQQGVFLRLPNRRLPRTNGHPCQCLLAY